MVDYVIVGVGFMGAVLAERIATQLDKKVMIIERRNHIGGNAYDYYNEQGILIHKYGPHIFHTRSKQVWDFLSNFTEWRLYHHQVLGAIDGKKVPIPFNLNSLHEVFPLSLASKLEEKLIAQFGFNVKVPILKLKAAEDTDLQYLADYIYENVFLNYTLKQWGIKPEELDPSVTGRVPVYISRDNRYFQDPFQGMPKHGYTKLFKCMLNNSNIKLLLNTDYKEMIQINFETGQIHLFEKPFTGKLIYTGPIDYFFAYKYGNLPYRSLDFLFDTLNIEQFQEVGTINYPNDYNFTRMTEFKHLTGQKSNLTTTVCEFSQEYIPGKNDAYYPINNDGNSKLYKKYKKEALNYNNIIFAGRLAEYQYYDMDAVVAKALKIFKEKLSDGP